MNTFWFIFSCRSASFALWNTTISPNFLVRKLCGNAHFAQSFRWFAWNSAKIAGILRSVYSRSNSSIPFFRTFQLVFRTFSSCWFCFCCFWWELQQWRYSHCMKSVQIRSYLWSVFSCIWTEYGELLRKSRIQSEYKKIRTRMNFVFGHFSRCVNLSVVSYNLSGLL